MAATGLAVGLNKGHLTTKREQAPRPNRTKGVRRGGARVVPFASAVVPL